MGCGGRGGLRLMLLGLDTAVGGGGARLLDFLLERLELRGLRWLGGPPCFLLVPFKWMETRIVDKNLVTKRIFSEASRLRDFEAGSTWDEVGVLGEGHEGLDVGEKVRI